MVVRSSHRARCLLLRDCLNVWLGDVYWTRGDSAFAAEANGILDLTEPEDHLHVFAKLESLVILTDGFTLPLPANG